MTRHQILEWDSEFFGFKVARILPERLQTGELEETLVELARDGVSLSYWASDPEDEASQEAARSLGGFLADRKVTYVIDADEMRARTVSPEVMVEPYLAETTTPELEELALQAGIYSRFRVDPRMPAGGFEELYRLWISYSVSGKIADRVLVVRESGRIVGMVTLGCKAGRADIGLVAVDASMRGKSLGCALVNAAQQWALDNGFDEAQVVTQGENEAACRLYEKAGYRVNKVENIYHFWSSHENTV